VHDVLDLVAHPVVDRVRHDAREVLVMAPTLREIDISLSFRMTMRSRSVWPALFSASYAMPLVSAPSPMTATTSKSSPFRSRAAAMPSAAEIEVAAWPAPKTSYSDSLRLRKPDGPPFCGSLERLVAAGQDLVRIALVADVPDELVARRVEDVVQRDGQLDDAEAGREVAADPADDVDHAVAHVLRDLRQLSLATAPAGRRGRDTIQ
jgi:hypothetical protein